MNENKLREQICVLATSIFDRGLTHGSTGNISVRLDDNNILVTPSGSSFGRLDPKQIVKVTKSGEIIGSTTPTKELPLHQAFYETRGIKSGAVVHLHSTYSVALSMIPEINEDKGFKLNECGNVIGSIKTKNYFQKLWENFNNKN